MDADIQVLNNGGPIADLLLSSNFDHRVLRPFVGEDGGNYVNNGKESVRPVNNATLRKDEWVYFDEVVGQVKRERLNFVSDLESMGLVRNLPNAMAHTSIEYQNISDISDADVSMDGLSKADSDRTVYDLKSMPVPIIHKDVYFSAREIATSRNRGVPVDVSTLEAATRKVAETIEKLHVGSYGTYKFAGGEIFGLRNFPQRQTTTVTDWTGSGKTNVQRLSDILALRQLLFDARCYGPFGIYVGNNLERYLDEDYKAESDITLRERILKVGQDKSDGSPGAIRFVKALDYLSAGDIVMVQLNTDTIQTVKGMGINIIQWPEQGGMRYHFKVMGIQLPRCRADYNNRSGIVHATQAVTSP